jgi:hypothetical protein
MNHEHRRRGTSLRLFNKVMAGKFPNLERNWSFRYKRLYLNETPSRQP